MLWKCSFATGSLSFWRLRFSCTTLHIFSSDQWPCSFHLRIQMREGFSKSEYEERNSLSVAIAAASRTLLLAEVPFALARYWGGWNHKQFGRGSPIPYPWASSVLHACCVRDFNRSSTVCCVSPAGIHCGFSAL